ncbi:uncharacterized protein LOC131856599 [Cryptomeria japonica]|uniref:uncharacterized protein LOC131856599 n=1 Tax=Cryptomeria japonica TaxID=3369 RepID=UPI0027DA2ED1|nr:uncharacterized protein LOC131856599 [Cryptomeria japonica]
MHLPGHVLRQFGEVQGIPVRIGAQQIRHGTGPRGRGGEDSGGRVRHGGGTDGEGRGGGGRGGGGIYMIATVAGQVDSDREDVDIGGETTSMSSSDDSDESRSGSSSSDGDEGGHDGYTMEMPHDGESVGVDRGDEEGLRDQVRDLEDLVTTLQQ